MLLGFSGTLAAIVSEAWVTVKPDASSETHNHALVAYVKSSPGNTVIVVVSLDPFGVQEGSAVLPAELGLPPVFPVEDLFTGEHFDWRIGGNYVRMEAGVRQAHVLRVAG